MQVGYFCLAAGLGLACNVEVSRTVGIDKSAVGLHLLTDDMFLPSTYAKKSMKVSQPK